ncbi:hypothetical protein DOY81_002130 [Sarcophaga bullata]|nr:hypothetical protein DOY81_002130 [Sarcophaga bullata]
MQKIPQTLASQRLVNVRPQGQSKIQQMKIETKSEKNIPIKNDEQEDENISDIIQIETKDNNTNLLEAEFQIQQQGQDPPAPQQQPLMSKPEPSVAKQPVRIVPAKRVEHMGTVQVRQIPTQTIKLNSNGAINANNQEIKTYSKPTATGNTSTSASSVIPLLTTPEICRQLLELRKQNEDLRRKYDLVQKEKEDFRLRLERLEELLLVERTDDDS